MTQSIEVNIADILAKIENKIDKLDDKLDQLSVDVAKLDSKVSGLDKRVENLEFIARTVGGGVIVALLLGLGKFLFPNFGV